MASVEDGPQAEVERLREAYMTAATELRARELHHFETKQKNAELRAEVERQAVLLRAVKDCHRDPARAILQADIIAGGAVLRAEAAEAREAALRARIEALADARGRRCGVCTGRSPHWDGHDKNPACEQAAWDALRAALASPAEEAR